MKSRFSRREFLQTTSIAGLGLALSPGLLRAQPILKTQVRLGFIGVGLRGCNHLHNVLSRQDVVVPAICDINSDRLTIASDMIVKSGRPKPELYTGGDLAFEKMLQRSDLDGVIIATPWLWHTRMAIASMKAGKYAGVEVSAANSLEECWDLVNTYESTRVPVMILENVCYRRDVMAVLNMVRQGIFGELEYAHCGYEHDLRGVKFEPGVEFGEKGVHEAKWRTQHSVMQNADLYPTHGLGPVATIMDINRGNRFLSISSSSTKTRGLHKYIVDHAGENHPNASIRFKLGDIITSVITTYNGENIVVMHDTNLPRPYSLSFRIQGTKGLWKGEGDGDYSDPGQQIYIEGISKPHSWDKAEDWLKKYDHPLWKKFEQEAEGAGHGGMDFFVDRAFVEIVKRGEEAPLDAYDAAAWSSVTPLSERSIAQGGEVQEFPDFTRGMWINRKSVFAMNDNY
jgi:predicted dehydrogenase